MKKYENLRIKKLEELMNFEGKHKLFNGSLKSPLCWLAEVEGFVPPERIGVTSLNAELKSGHIGIKVQYQQDSFARQFPEKSIIYVYDRSGFK